MYKRHLESILKKLSKKYPIITITGPRQSGKTTLAKHAFPNYMYVSLEDPDVRLFAEQDPRGFLDKYKTKVVFDEIQRVPALFSYLQTIVDRTKKTDQFILTGSEQILLSEKISQSLAGRTAILKLLPFSYAEIKGKKPNKFWFGDGLNRLKDKMNLFKIMFTGFYPRIYDKNLEPTRWYGEYFETYVTRDVRRLLNIGDLKTFETFVYLLAGRNGQLLNLTSLGNDSGVSHTTAKRWISILEASYIISLVQPYYKNFSKRQIKTPKIYFLDTGLLCYLLKMRSYEDLINHPLRGQIFESFVFSELLKNFYHQGDNTSFYYWKDRTNKEIDILIDLGKKFLSIEIKSAQTITEAFFYNLNIWKKIFNSSQNKEVLVYGGSDYQTRNDIQIIPWYGIS